MGRWTDALVWPFVSPSQGIGGQLPFTAPLLQTYKLLCPHTPDETPHEDIVLHRAT